MSKYTNTPVTETYNQIGQVIRASFLCLGHSLINALYAVNNINGSIIAARGMWVARIM